MNDTTDLIAANELVAESNERLSNTVNGNTNEISKLNNTAESQLEAVHKLAQSVVDYSVARRNELRQKIEQQKPIIRYSNQTDDKPAVKEIVHQPVKVKNNESEQPKPTFARVQNEGASIVGAIGKMGVDIARSISSAAKDFAGNIVDTLGSEILPLYPQLKQAAMTVGEGTVKAVKTGVSAFKRVPNEQSNDKKVVERTETKSFFERLTTNTEKSEKTFKFSEKMQAHRDHKLYKKVDDIYDFMKLRALFDVLSSGKMLLGIAGVGSAITGLLGIFGASGFIGSRVIKIIDLFKSFGQTLSKMYDKVTKFFDGLADKAKSMAKEGADKLKQTYKTVKEKVFGPESKTVMKDGKPVIGTDGKPVRATAVQNVAGESSKFSKIGAAVTEASPTLKAGAVAGEAVAAESAVAGAATRTALGGALRGVLAALGTLGGALSGLGWILTGYEIKTGVENALGVNDPENMSPERKELYRRMDETGSLDDPMNIKFGMQRGLPSDSDIIENTETQVKQAEAVKEQRKEQKMSAQHQMINSPMTVVNNNVTHQSEPFRFASDSFSQMLPYGLQRR